MLHPFPRSYYEAALLYGCLPRFYGLHCFGCSAVPLFFSWGLPPPIGPPFSRYANPGMPHPAHLQDPAVLPFRLCFGG